MAKKKDESSRRPFLKRMLGDRPWGRYLALVAALAWMFVLGLLVGRGTAPVRFDLEALTRELSERKQADMQREAQWVKNGAADAGQKTDLEFYEALKKTLPPRRPAEKKTAKEKRAAVQRKITPPAVKTQPPKTADSGGSGGELTIQAASLRGSQDADVLVGKLKAKGYPAFKTVAKIPERGTWYRVRVGRFASEGEAAGLMKKLESEGFDPLLVRQD
jgi:cell division septation protein DedD